MKFFNKVHVKKISLCNGKELTIIQDVSPFHFGTKLRKANGVLEHLIQNKIHSIVLHGNPNSNYMACFTTYFRAHGFYVNSLLYSHSENKNLNYWITLKNSSSVFFAKSRSEFIEIKNFLSNSESYIFPKYSACLESLLGLFSLWKEIDWDNYREFALDIGSGLTLLSLLYFLEIHQVKELKVIGICIGRKKEKLVEELKSLSIELFNRVLDFSAVVFLDPILDPKFGKYSQILLEHCKLYAERGILIEPIYSAKSLYTIESLMSNSKYKFQGLAYLHQGGLLPFYKYFLEFTQPV